LFHLLGKHYHLFYLDFSSFTTQKNPHFATATVTIAVAAAMSFFFH